MQRIQTKSLGQEDSLEEKVVIHYRILAWKIPWMEDPGRFKSMGSQRVGHDLASGHIYMSVIIFYTVFLNQRQTLI